MDTRSTFGVILVLVALGGLFALVTGWVKIANGQLTIADPGSSASPTSTTPAPGSGTINTQGIGGGTYASVPAATQSTTDQLASNLQKILASVGTSAPDVLSSYYASPSISISGGESGIDSAANGIAYA